MADNKTGLGTITDILNTEPNWNRAIEVERALNAKLMGYPGTVQKILSWSDDLPAVVAFKLTNASKQDEFDLLTFFNLMKGRLGKFWVRSELKEFGLSQDMPQNSTGLYVNDNKFDLAYRGYERIYLDMANGDLITRKVTSVSSGPGAGELTLQIDTVTDRQINRADVRKFGRFLLVRFDVDKISFEHGEKSISDVEVKLRELVKEYP